VRESHEEGSECSEEKSRREMGEVEIQDLRESAIALFSESTNPLQVYRLEASAILRLLVRGAGLERLQAVRSIVPHANNNDSTAAALAIGILLVREGNADLWYLARRSGRVSSRFFLLVNIDAGVSAVLERRSRDGEFGVSHGAILFVVQRQSVGVESTRLFALGADEEKGSYTGQSEQDEDEKNDEEVEDGGVVVGNGTFAHKAAKGIHVEYSDLRS
jgi:hypothetical protein